MQRIGGGPKRVGITGCNGDVGRILRRQLTNLGYQVVAITWKPLPILSGHDAKESADHLDAVVENRFGDLTDEKQVKGLFNGLDALIHLAAYPKPWESWDLIYRNNIPVDYNVFSECVQAGVRRVIYASTNHVQHGRSMTVEGPQTLDYKNIGAHLPGAPLIKLEDPVEPDSYYAVAKITGEALGRYFARIHGLEFVALRIGWLVPEKDPFESKWVDAEDYRHYMRAMYLGHRDCQEIFMRALEALPASSRLGKGAYVLAYAVSNNARRVFDLTTSAEAIGYKSVECAEPYFEAYQARKGNAKPGAIKSSL